MKEKRKRLVFFVVIIVLCVGLYFVFQKVNRKNESNFLSGTSISEIDTSINTDDGETKVDWDSLKEEKIYSNESLVITEEGIYTLTGSISGMVTVNTTGSVKLVLSGVNITNSVGPAIFVEQAENVVIELMDNTTNTLKDSSSYEMDDSEVTGTIYSKDDLIFDGNGTLVIDASYEDGIVSKDDLKIISGNYQITAIDDGIRGKDSVYIQNGTFDITSGGDAIKSTNDTDTEKGYILIEHGTFKIDSELDGMDATTKLVIQNGKFNIMTGGGSNNVSTSDSWGNWGKKTYSSQSTNTNSAKGLKANGNLIIENGTFDFNTSDDAIHSNSYVGIKGGTYAISSGDDGIHADTELIIEGGDIDITKSYEGIESAKMTISGGEIRIISSDDGVNIAGGNDSSGMNRPGQNTYTENTNNILTVSGGKIFVDAKGDGIDINGSGYVTGGEIIVEGPTDGGNGGLDYDREFVVSGGTVLIFTSTEMLQQISSSDQYNVTVYLSNSSIANEEVTVVDSKEQEIFSYTPTENYPCIMFSSTKLMQNNTYTIKVSGEKIEEFTISSLSTVVGSNYGSSYNHGSGGNGGGGPRR